MATFTTSRVTIHRFEHRPQLTLEPLEDRTMLSTCHVTRLSDSGVGKGFRGDLRYCINKANAEPGPDAIDFNVTGTINLTGALPNLSSDIAIAGPGAAQLTVRRDSGGDYRIFTVNTGANVEIYNVTITNGSDEYGGGLRNDGSLILANVFVVFNKSAGSHARPGGIYNTGTLLAYNTSISGNTTTASGGGIYNRGSMTLVGCMISENSSPAGGGGGIVNVAAGANLTLEHSVVAGNDAVEGGGIENEANLMVLSSTVMGNTASGGFNSGGGGILNEGVATIRDTAIHDNLSNGYGGGIRNNATGDVTVVNSTIAGNTAGTEGGGIFNNNGNTLTLANSTVSDNSAEKYGGIFAACGGCFNFFRNSIVAGNTATTFPDFKGWLNTSGFNVFGNSSGVANAAETDLLDVDPLLGPLADNGGPTQTMALLPGSPAIDAGDNAGAPDFDQRGPGFPRIVNGTIDIGAFEVQSSAAPSVPRVARAPYLLMLILATADWEAL